MTAIIDGTNGVTTPNVLTSSSGVALTLQSGGTTAVTIDTSQNVGIGTASPADILHLSSTSPRLTFTSTNNTSGARYNTVGTATSGSHRFQYGGTEVLTVGITGQTVALQGATPSSGAGITFPATQSASSDANTLDDYEEGSWTPTLSSSTGSYTSVTYGKQYGKYTKIGNLVYAMFDMSTTSQVVGTASSDLIIAGFPFTMANSGVADSYSGYIGFSTGLVTPCSGLLQYSSGNNRVYIGITAGGTLAVSSQGSTGFGIRATICYQAA